MISMPNNTKAHDHNDNNNGILNYFSSSSIKLELETYEAGLSEVYTLKTIPQR